MVLCNNCNWRVATQKHHVKYFPEETVPICDPCHSLIHSGFMPLLTIRYIKYPPGDGKLFYSQKKRIDGFLHHMSNKRKRKKR